MSDVQVNTSMGFLGWLGLTFIILKLTGFIHWSWILVLAPIWISAALALTFFVIFLVLALAGGRQVRRSARGWRY